MVIRDLINTDSMQNKNRHLCINGLYGPARVYTGHKAKIQLHLSHRD